MLNVLTFTLHRLYMLIYTSMHKIPQALVPLAIATGPIYGTAVRLKNTLYESSILRSDRLQSPVISIGNITTGGAGKTPLVIYTAKKIIESGLIPAILSRGYGRPDPGIERVISPGESVKSPFPDMGDEPALIRRHVPGAWFGISKNRYAAGRRIEQATGKPVFILDDGFQHRKLHRDLDVVVIDSSQPLLSNHIFPRGTLREPIAGLHRSQAIILNGARRSGTSDPVRFAQAEPRLQKKLFYCEQTIEGFVPFNMWKEGSNPATNFPYPDHAFLTAALGNPERFHADVQEMGVQVCGTLFFKDHYNMRPEDWYRCVEMARQASADAILVTEKDAVKISEPPDFPLLVCVQTTKFSDPEAFEELLHQGINRSLYGI
jgi:tetraacyldisaccharide 4'-kinase